MKLGNPDHYCSGVTVPIEDTGVRFASGLRSFGESPAVMVGERVISYRTFANLVEDFAARLGPRRLVLLAADNSLESLVAYVAALQAGQALLLAQADAPAAVAALVGAYDPDVIVRTGPEGLTLEEVRPVTRHELHPELALLLSTSGSTGSPKLVRLSQDNLQSNAQSIAEYLGIGSGDRAMTTLPMHYCYGLSVINSHLLRGACLILTELSVVDACFWQVFKDRGATSFAAVPYTFELLDRAGFVDMDLPTLRYVTQAGGRLHPEMVRRYARLGAARGWELYVMYGQTEATARMAYLPPAQAIENADAIGVAVPGGSFRIDPVPGSGDGELVYTGPNVMLGYAAAPADLATGRTIDELRTGDLARRKANGLFQIVGRRSRFVKIVGLRLDLGQVETKLADLPRWEQAPGGGQRRATVLRRVDRRGSRALRAGLKSSARRRGTRRRALDAPLEALRLLLAFGGGDVGGGAHGLRVDHPGVLLELGDERVQQVRRRRVLFIHFVMDLAHGADRSLKCRDDLVDGVLGVDQAGRELGEGRGLGDRGAAAVRQGVQGAHALGHLIREGAGCFDDFIQLQVQVPEVRSHDVPVRLLALDVQFDQVHEHCLTVGCEGR